MLHHKLADDDKDKDRLSLNFMKDDTMEQTKLQKTVYSKFDDSNKKCLLISPGKMKDESSMNGVTAINKA